MSFKFADYTIKRKLLLAFLCIVLLNAIPLAVSFYTLTTMRAALDTSREESEEMDYFNQIKTLIIQQQMKERDYLLTGEDRFLKGDEELDDIIDELVESAIKAAENEEEKEEIREVAEEIEEYEDSFEKVLTLFNDGQRRQALRVATGEHQKAIDDVNESIDELLLESKSDVYTAFLKAGEHSDAAMTLFSITLIAAVLSVFFAIILSYVLSNNLALPLLQLRDVADRVSKGDLKAKIRIRRNDEIGELAASFERMVTAVRFFAQELKQRKKR